ncbi:MAG: hypothetical protein HW416_3903 [Chloroflexi bacterium]|nr:hypothetical protein [Chloroflexota bacterium]
METLQRPVCDRKAPGAHPRFDHWDECHPEFSVTEIPSAQESAASPDHARVTVSAPARDASTPVLHWMLLGLSVAVTVALSIWAAARREVGVFIYGRVSYWLILALVMLWVWQISRLLVEQRFNLVSFARRNWVPLVAALGMTAIAVSSVKPQFRVLSDETNLLAVSQSMLYHKTVFNSTEQKRFYGWMNPLTFGVEKRPLVFPFFVQVIHSIRGYSPSNPFVLNAIALFTLLAMIGLVVGRSLGRTATVAAVVLVGSYPLIVTSGTSAGLDLLATVFTGLSFVLTYVYMRSPSGSRLALLFSTLLVFAQIRYETSVYVGLIGLSLLLFGYVRARFLREHFYLYCLAPFLLLPLQIQRILTPDSHENAAGTAAFSWTHLKNFLAIFLRAQGNTEFLLPHAPLLYWLAVPSLIFLFVRVLQRRASLDLPCKVHLLLMSLVAFAINYVIVFSFHGSDFTHPGAARYFLNMSVLIALLPVFLHVQLPMLVTGPRLLLFAVGFALVHHPISVQSTIRSVCRASSRWCRSSYARPKSSGISCIVITTPTFSSLSIARDNSP